jgi:hypothetical protein
MDQGNVSVEPVQSKTRRLDRFTATFPWSVGVLDWTGFTDTFPWSVGVLDWTGSTDTFPWFVGVGCEPVQSNTPTDQGNVSVEPVQSNTPTDQGNVSVEPVQCNTPTDQGNVSVEPVQSSTPFPGPLVYYIGQVPDTFPWSVGVLDWTGFTYTFSIYILAILGKVESLVNTIEFNYIFQIISLVSTV